MKNLSSLIKSALNEDNAGKDITSSLFIPAAAKARADIIAKQAGIICGMEMIREIYRKIDKRCRVRLYAKDGLKVRGHKVIAEISGPARSVLAGERTVINFLQHLSGVATLTNKYVELAKGTGTKIYDTRKTLPGMRALEKYAVTCGGGTNHRQNLGEMALIKDNHLKLIGDPAAAVRKVRSEHRNLIIEVECETLGQVRKMIESGANIIMLDNMSRSQLRKAVKLIRTTGKGVKIEISGGVNLKTVRGLARLGADRISVGAITHSAPALDISMEII
jgi:nicotinate-nucleotide pyrophosphorylase (carboxylating)